MKTVTRRWLAVLLAAVMVCPLLSAAAVSAAAPEDVIADAETARMEMTADTLGLAFRFSLDVQGVTANADYIFDLSNATVDAYGDGKAYPLVTVGALVSNDPEVGLRPADFTHAAFSSQTKIVVAKYANLATANELKYSVRVTNIPVAKSDAVLYARAFYTFDCDGEYITVYGEVQSTNYDDNLNMNDGIFDW